MTADLAVKIERLLGQSVGNIVPLSGGDVGEVYKVECGDGSSVVAKVENVEPIKLEKEARMLDYLSKVSQLPVPGVIQCSDGLLILEYIEGQSRFTAEAQEHAAELLAALHDITQSVYGFEEDTLIGSLHQPNPLISSWVEFFGEHRLFYMAHEGHNAGKLPGSLLNSVEAFCQDLERWLVEPNPPGLIHGDAWTGNILSNGDRIAGFLDPAIYFADPEIELAFTTLFRTFGKPFFDRYGELRPIAPGFFEERKDIYNLYPLLVHVRLFGGAYVNSAAQTLKNFGY